MKALIISIGTGIGGENAIESLVHGINFSIKSNNPNKIFFVVSEDSKTKTLPKILEHINFPYDVILITDPNNINKIYDELSPHFKEIKQNFDYITIDYTSGTKSMTGALAILGTLYEVDTLSYVSGKREGGIVVKGTEELLNLYPYSVISEKRLAEAIAFFNNYRFDACLTILSQIEKGTPYPSLISRISILKNTALAYSAWDKFNHEQAFTILKEVKLSQFDRNKEFLGKLLNSCQKEPYYIADLLNNAKRRGETEQKYDDAVARLYRTTELIAQYKLKTYGIGNTSNVPFDRIPAELISEFKVTEGEVKIGLYQAYKLLAHYNDEIGIKFIENKKLKDLLNRRNNSILAHGLTPVTRNDYEKFKSEVLTLASMAISNLDSLLSLSTFTSWAEHT